MQGDGGHHGRLVLDGLLEHPGCQVDANLPDLCVGEGGPPGQLLLAQQLHQGLGGPADHPIGDLPRLAEGGAQGKAGEYVPERKVGRLRQL